MATMLWLSWATLEDIAALQPEAPEKGPADVAGLVVPFHDGDEQDRVEELPAGFQPRRERYVRGDQGVELERRPPRPVSVPKVNLVAYR